MLDVATGTGLVAEALLARGFRVTGLDQSAEQMLALARERFGDRVVFVEVEHFVAAREQPVGEVGADKARPPGNQNLSSVNLLWSDTGAEFGLPIVESLLPSSSESNPHSLRPNRGSTIHPLDTARCRSNSRCRAPAVQRTSR